jgi:sigma-B regulation protein RsbU (phosphoserine phosphatase)
MPPAFPSRSKSLSGFFRPKTKLGKVTLWAFLLWLLLSALSYAHGWVGSVSEFWRLVALVVLLCTGIPLAARWVSQELLWRLRNRLIVNYMLIGLAPFVLLATLCGVLGYSLAGQFAVFTATGELDRSIRVLANEDHSFALHVAHDMAKAGSAGLYLPESEREDEGSHLGRTVNVFYDGKPIMVPSSPHLADPTITEVPPWIKSGSNGGSFSGVVKDGKRFYLRAVDTLPLEGHVTTVITSEPLAEVRLAKMASGLGQVALFDTPVLDDDLKGGKTHKASQSTVHFDYGKPQTSVVRVDNGDGNEVAVNDAASVHGGTLPPSAGVYDINVTFPTMLPLRDWNTGDAYDTPLSVSSRPTQLYQKLFATSLTFGNIIRVALISIAILFALIELVALVMAVRLNHTITHSVSDLYEATVRVDSGDLSHQIVVERDDQLAELSRSFNKMIESLGRLIEEQKEKERMQGELAIAQEVQNNLFPHINVWLPQLEVHGFCRPARTVSGDYYDFLLLGENSLALALGDISGKGISAALLMAALHSAVRAYRFASQEITSAELVEAATAGGRSFGASYDYAQLFESPSRIVTLLNRHLYRSTEPEKYATLWLGHYYGDERKLVYSTCGQLPPLVLRANGDVVRLDCGGTVVGLLDGVSYEEGTVFLDPEDIVIAYSDGVTEPENEFGDFGEERLLEVVRRNRKQSLATISSQVMLALDDWIGGQEQPDDITLVLARQL